MAEIKPAAWDPPSNKYEDFILELRKDLIEFISSNKLTEDDILQWLSKSIVSGEIEISHRLQLLIVLQENSSALLTTDERLELAVSSLINYSETLKSVNNNFFKGQLLVTITVVLLDYINSTTKTLVSLLSRYCDQLWQILDGVNNKDNCLLREIAIECLLEIEESFPCIFLNKLEEINNMCFKENLYPFQNYCNLISCILKNTANVSTESRTNDVLVMMKKSPLIDDINHYASHVKVNAITTKLLDFVPLLSAPSIHYVVSNVVHLIDMFKLNPLILKTFMHRYMMTSDAILFNLLLALKDAFQDNLLSNSEDDALMMLLSAKCEPLFLTETNLLLALNYVRKYMDKEKINSARNKRVISNNFFLPRPLDSLRVKEIKLGVFSKLLPNIKENEWHSQTFLESINGICLQLSRDSHGHYTAALCRILYHNSIMQSKLNLETEYHRIALSVMKHHPHFSMHIMNLMKKIKLVNPNNMFFSNVLSTTVHHVTHLPIGCAKRKLHHYLLFLAEAALENSEYSQPKAILRFLQKILNQNCQNLSWLLGHALLNVCKHILGYHNTNILFADLGEVLHTIISQNGDVDVRDRAQFYYMLLTTLSPNKITAMFQQKVQKSAAGSTFNSFIPGDTTYGIPAPVLHLNHPVLCLSSLVLRITVREQESSICDKEKEKVDGDDYLRWLTESNYFWKACIECSLSIVSHADGTYNDIYGVILSFAGPSFCAEIPHVSVPHLGIEKPHTFSLEVQMGESRRTSISISAVFSSSKGQTCCAKLDPLILEFRDLFQPLPIYPSWRKHLANGFWEEFTTKFRKTGSSDYHQSVLRLLLEKHIYPELLDQELKDFITESSSPISATVGVFLPPRNHLIMKLRHAANDGMIVHMATDSKHVLAQVNLYFCKLEKKYSKSEYCRLSEIQ